MAQGEPGALCWFTGTEENFPVFYFSSNFPNSSGLSLFAGDLGVRTAEISRSQRTLKRTMSSVEEGSQNYLSSSLQQWKISQNPKHCSHTTLPLKGSCTSWVFAPLEMWSHAESRHGICFPPLILNSSILEHRPESHRGCTGPDASVVTLLY